MANGCALDCQRSNARLQRGCSVAGEVYVCPHKFLVTWQKPRAASPTSRRRQASSGRACAGAFGSRQPAALDINGREEGRCEPSPFASRLGMNANPASHFTQSANPTMIAEFISAICERRLLKRRLKQIRSETLPYKNVITMLDTCGQAFNLSRPMILNLAQEFLPSGTNSSLETYQLITIRYLLDRVTSTPVSILRLILMDPVLAGPDAASLHRSTFEAAVNFLYLVHRDRDTRFRSFYVMAFERERRMYNEIHRWCDNDDEHIATYAKYQLSIQDHPQMMPAMCFLRNLALSTVRMSITIRASNNAAVT